jgi:hypothetical protein
LSIKFSNLDLAATTSAPTTRNQEVENIADKPKEETVKVV